jgi:C-terminal processing protease CtpA/Prc
MVVSMFAGSEADRAGIREGDILLNIQEIGAAGGFKKFFADGKTLKILRWEQNGSVINYKNLAIRLKGGK